jgi:hypothetical protein
MVQTFRMQIDQSQESHLMKATLINYKEFHIIVF